jgi:uncharacterized protein YuzE
MATKNAKMSYDSEEDILSLSKGIKVKASIDIGDFIIDVDHRGLIVGLEILNASQNIGLKEEFLKSLEQASMQVTYKPNSVFIAIYMKMKNKEKEIRIPLTVDLGHGAVKTEKTQFAVASC